MDVDAVVSCFHPDAISHDPVGTPALIGHDAIRGFFTNIFSAFEKVGLTEDCVFIGSNTGAVKWTGEGIGKNGKPVEFEGIDIIQSNEAGQIVLLHAYWDPAPVMKILQS